MTDKEQGNEDRWILGSIHRWRPGASVRIESPVERPEDDPDDWHIKVNWRLVDGQAQPVGLEIHSSFGGQRKGDPWPEGGRPKVVSRELTKRLPVGEIIEQGRLQVSAIWDWVSSGAPDPVESERVARGLRNRSGPESPADWKYRLTAQVYEEVLADRKRGLVGNKVALETAFRLARDHKIEATDVRVRKWIAEARRRDYLPPSGRDRPTTPARSATTEGLTPSDDTNQGETNDA